MRLRLEWAMEEIQETGELGAGELRIVAMVQVEFARFSAGERFLATSRNDNNATDLSSRTKREILG
jgi:hypothetical protein